MHRRPVPEPIAPGQESVWDYPRPPAIRACDEEIIVVLGGVEIWQTRTSWRYLETSHPPTYYLPRTAFLEGALRPAGGHTFCEGRVRRPISTWSAATVARRAAWYYPDPNPAYAKLRDHVAVYPGPMDRCLVDGELVVPQPGTFYGGWIISAVSGPFKGGTGTMGW